MALPLCVGCGTFYSSSRSEPRLQRVLCKQSTKGDDRNAKCGEKHAKSEVIGLPLSQLAEKEHSSSTAPTAPTRLIHCTLVVKSFLSEKLFQPIMSELCNSAKSRNLRLQCIQVRLRSAKLMRALFCPTGTNSRYTLHRLREISIL